jgi:D-threo-aldose 1-dehydrogenase
MTKKPLSRLGFGLSSLAGSGNFAHQQNLINTAIDCGVTHFDSAPYYGSGDAEKILGRVLRKCRCEVTITTKFGLVPFAGGNAGSLVRATLRPVLRRIRPLKLLAARLIHGLREPEQLQNNIRKSAILESLDASIRDLGRPVDALLLHDASAATASHPVVHEALAEVRASGKCRFAGISGAAAIITAAARKYPRIYEVAQLENSLICPAPIAELSELGTRVITFRAIQNGLREIISLVERSPGFKKTWLHEFGVDPSSPDLLAQALVEVALAENPNGTVLFSTTNPKRIRVIARALSSPVLAPQASGRVRAFFEAAQELKGREPKASLK